MLRPYRGKVSKEIFCGGICATTKVSAIARAILRAWVLKRPEKSKADEYMAVRLMATSASMPSSKGISMPRKSEAAMRHMGVRLKTASDMGAIIAPAVKKNGVLGT